MDTTNECDLNSGMRCAIRAARGSKGTGKFRFMRRRHDGTIGIPNGDRRAGALFVEDREIDCQECVGGATGISHGNTRMNGGTSVWNNRRFISNVG